MAYKRRLTDVHNLPDAHRFRVSLRRRLTPAEARLWTLLKNSQLEGRKFRRQHSVGPYVLDFYCPSEKLAVELDGEGHFHTARRIHDSKRRSYLENYGIRVIRFENKSVFQGEARVLDRIRSEFGWSKTR